MSLTIFGIFVAAIGIWCQFGSYQRTVVAMFGLVVLGAASALDLPALGGASVTPANFFLLFYLLRLLSMRGGTSALIAEVGPRRPLFIFFLLVLWIMASAMLMPRLFDGATWVFSLSRAADNDGGGTVPLHPTSGNLSQAVYAAGGFMVACATCAYARRTGGYRALLSAIVLVTSLHLGFAIVDVVTSATHTGFILDLVHTASYAFLTDDELGGLKRISGSFSEASAFASFSLTLLAVNVSLFVSGIRPRFTGTASALLAIFIVLSTSSAGYAGLGVFYAVFLAYAVFAGLVQGKRRVVTIAVLATGGAVLVISLVILFIPAIANVAEKVISESLLNKGTTDSAVERGSWNTQALQVFHDTHWLGGGIGSTRGSNYLLVLLSNLGAIGFGLFVILMLRVTLCRLSPLMPKEDRAVVRAAQMGLLTTMIPSILVGTVYDLGTLFYALMGIAASSADIVPRAVRSAARRRAESPMDPRSRIHPNPSFRSRA
jgi:hypothetical protein